MYYPTEFGSAEIEDKYKGSVRQFSGENVQHTPNEKKDIFTVRNELRHRGVTMLCDCIRYDLITELENLNLLTKCAPVGNDMCPMCGYYPYYLKPNNTMTDEEYLAALREMNA